MCNQHIFQTDQPSIAGVSFVKWTKFSSFNIKLRIKVRINRATTKPNNAATEQHNMETTKKNRIQNFQKF